VSPGKTLAGGCLALALAGLPATGVAQATPQGDVWRAFEGSWAISGQRYTVPAEGGATAAVFEASGAVVLAKADGLSHGFRGEAITFDDGLGVSLGRAVWTDEHGDRLFSRLKGEPLETGKRIVGTITGGTGRYAGLEGEYSFTWQYVLSAEDGAIQGRAVRLQGRVRHKGTTP
jgi:hypothetical protein